MQERWNFSLLIILDFSQNLILESETLKVFGKERRNSCCIFKKAITATKPIEFSYLFVEYMLGDSCSSLREVHFVDWLFRRIAAIYPRQPSYLSFHGYSYCVLFYILKGKRSLFSNQSNLANGMWLCLFLSPNAWTTMFNKHHVLCDSSSKQRKNS